MPTQKLEIQQVKVTYWGCAKTKYYPQVTIKMSAKAADNSAAFADIFIVTLRIRPILPPS